MYKIYLSRYLYHISLQIEMCQLFLFPNTFEVLNLSCSLFAGVENGIGWDFSWRSLFPRPIRRGLGRPTARSRCSRFRCVHAPPASPDSCRCIGAPHRNNRPCIRGTSWRDDFAIKLIVDVATLPRTDR